MSRITIVALVLGITAGMSSLAGAQSNSAIHEPLNPSNGGGNNITTTPRGTSPVTEGIGSIRGDSSAATSPLGAVGSSSSSSSSSVNPRGYSDTFHSPGVGSGRGGPGAY
jgi:hypothetical protein